MFFLGNVRQNLIFNFSKVLIDLILFDFLSMRNVIKVKKKQAQKTI